MPETTWERTKKYSGSAYSKALKPGFDKAWNALDKLGAPVNRLSNKLGSEAFWPTTLDKESAKAARILRSFCKDGFYEKIDTSQAKKAEETGEKIEGPKGKQKVLKKIPEKVIRQAKGLAIFTTMRTGLWVSGAGGSGVLVARDEKTGEWSPPSGILLHTAGVGFLVGVDIYDCVVVINSYKALEAFTKIRCTLGGEVSAVAGPVGMGGVLDTEVHKRQAPVWTYLKSRGFYAGVQVDGTIVIERSDENERFYGEKIPVVDILAGKARYPPKDQYRVLIDTIHAAQGDDVDESLLPAAGVPTPGDQIIDVDSEGSSFGIPDVEDPDPYGVKALESQGIVIREAATQERPSGEIFEFRPAQTSPIYATFARASADFSVKTRANGWRGSMQSIGTQTDEDENNKSSPVPSPKPTSLRSDSPAIKTTEHVTESGDEHEESSSPDPNEEDDLRDDDADEEVEIHEAQTVVAQAKMVQIPKRLPPQLPPRNPSRMSGPPPAQENEESEEHHKDPVEPNHTEESRDAALEIQPATDGLTPGEEQFHSTPSSPAKEKAEEDFS